MDLHRANDGHDIRECGIAVVQQVPRRLVLGNGVAELLGAELLGRPCGRGMVGDGDGQPRPQNPVCRSQTTWRGTRAIQDRQLMPEREDLEVQRRVGSGG